MPAEADAEIVGAMASFCSGSKAEADAVTVAEADQVAEEELIISESLAAEEVVMTG